MSLNVKLITSDRVVFDSVAEEAIIPSITGQVGILANHAPMISAVDTGVLRIKYENKWLVIIVFGGFVEVRDNQVTIVTNDVEEASKLDFNTVKTKLTEAFDSLDKAKTSKEKIRASGELKKASARVQAAMYLQ